MILPEMIFLSKIHKGTAKTFSILNTLNTTWHVRHGASKTPNDISQCFTKDHIWRWRKKDQHATVCLTGTCQNIGQIPVPLRCDLENRFHTRTCPFSFHLLATDWMRTHTASVGRWFFASCSCKVSILQTGKPCALRHFRRTQGRCARPHI